MERASYSFSVEEIDCVTEEPWHTKLNFFYHWNSKTDCTTKKTQIYSMSYYF